MVDSPNSSSHSASCSRRTLRWWAIGGPLLGFVIGSFGTLHLQSTQQVMPGQQALADATHTTTNATLAPALRQQQRKIEIQQSDADTDTTTTPPQQQEPTYKPFDLLPHLPNCDKPQSSRSLTEMAIDYKPSKFWRYLHTNFDRFYPLYMERFRTKKFRMLEIGLDTGKGSLLWAEYFPCATLVGLEYNPANTKNQGASTIQTIVGDQGDVPFLQGEFLRQADGGNFDLIIDDGGHHYEQQRASYEVLFDKALNPGGLYVMEDIETSYWAKGQDLYGNPVTRGGKDEPTTIINHFKEVVNVVNKKFHDNTYTVFGQVDQLVSQISFGSNVVFLEKKTKDHCWNERPYVWPSRLDGPAANQPLTANDGSLVEEFCKSHGIKTQVRDAGRGYLIETAER